MMRVRIRRVIGGVLATAIAGALLMLAPGSAHADGADVDTEVFTATATFPFVDVCTGVVTGTVTSTFKEVRHQVMRPTGTSMTRVNLHGDFVIVPNDPALQTVTGHFARVLERETGGGAAVDGTVLNVVGRTTDGTKFRAHVVTHHTENGLGITVVDFQKGC
jgi:hypothetical protein